MSADFLLERDDNELFHHAENEEDIEMTEQFDIADVKINDFILVKKEFFIMLDK